MRLRTDRSLSFGPGIWLAILGCGIGCLGAGHGWAAGPPPRDRPFPDVPQDHWAYDAVEELRKLGILRGYPPEPPPRVRPSTPQQVAPPRRSPRRPAPPATPRSRRQ